MTLNRILGLTILVGVVSMFIWERGAVAKLRQQNESLRAEKEEAARLGEENRELPKRREVAEAASGSSGERSELLRLRNEARRLRAQKQELEKLRAENQRLAANLQSGNVAPSKLSEMEGFMGKETWATAGMATPENTMQTFFWAFSTGNFEQLMKCVTPETARELKREMEQRPDQFQQEFFGESNPFRKVSGFRIAERTTLAEDKMKIGVQVAANGEVMTLPLRRVGNEWKVDMR